MRLIILLILLLPLTASAQTVKEMRDSLALASKELAHNPYSVDLRLKKAGWNMRLEQWEYALKEYDVVLKNDSRNVAALYFRAYANEKLGRYKYARADYESLLKIVPAYFEARLGLALLNQKDKHFTEALDQLNSLCNNFPDRSEAFAARAGVEQERGMLELAEFDYGEALRLEPDNIDYRLCRIDVRLRLGRKKEAKADLDELVKQGVAKPSLADLYRATE